MIIIPIGNNNISIRKMKPYENKKKRRVKGQRIIEGHPKDVRYLLIGLGFFVLGLYTMIYLVQLTKKPIQEQIKLMPAIPSETVQDKEN